MPTTNPSPYLPTTSARYHSLTSLNPLSPQKTSHEGHSPTTPVNKFARSQVKLLENRISQLIQMVEDDTASAEEAAKPINGGGQKSKSYGWMAGHCFVYGIVLIVVLCRSESQPIQVPTPVGVEAIQAVSQA